MSHLIQLGDGTWINPGSVTSVVAHAGLEFGDKKIPPRVIIRAGRTSLEWEHADLKTAQAYANHLAGLCNGDDE